MPFDFIKKVDESNREEVKRVMRLRLEDAMADNCNILLLVGDPEKLNTVKMTCDSRPDFLDFLPHAINTVKFCYAGLKARKRAAEN